MSVKISYKTTTSQNFRQLIDVKNLDVCAIIKNVNNFPAFFPYRLWFNETLSGQVHECPYNSLYIQNSTFVNSKFMREKHGVSIFDVPDGQMRCNLNSEHIV